MNKTPLVKTDYKNRFNRQIWIEERRRDLQHYFSVREINNGPIPLEPLWCIIPRSSIWRIPSLGTPGFEGWYGIAGDHPTDTVPLSYFTHSPRHILEHFVTKWLRAAQRLKQGEDYGDFRIGQIEERPTIGELIEDRALKIQRWVEAEDLWHPVAPIRPADNKINNDDE